MLSQKNKKNTIGIFTVLFFGLLFFTVLVPDVLAEQTSYIGAAQSGVVNGDAVPDGGDGVFVIAMKWLLYGILQILIGLVQVGASLFAWTTRPEYISGPTGLLNLAVVYELWKFIRDFFNLFFIFFLLFSAFATVFQYEKFNLKNNFFKIILAAVVINFSFPLTRIIIDFGNVPMYFFAQGITNLNGQGNALMSIPQAFFASSGITEIGILPDPSREGTLVPLLTAVIFNFIFMITIFSLAFLFAIRLLKLVIILIFSPLGLAASIVPGLEAQGKKWWDQLIETVFFGPAAMLMIVIALRFTLEIQGSQFATGLGATAPAATAASQSSIVRQGIFFIPIILMWMAMQIGRNASDSFSKAVMNKADGALAWGKKQALFGKGSWTRGGASFVGRKVDTRLAESKYGKYASVGAWKKAWKDRSASKKHQDEAPVEVAAGAHQDLLNKRISQAKNIGATVLPWNWFGKNAAERRRTLKENHWNTDHTEYENAALVKQATAAAKHIEEISDNYINNDPHIRNAIASQDAAELMGHLKVLAKNNDFNELVPAMGADFMRDLKKVGAGDPLKEGEYKVAKLIRDKTGKIIGRTHKLKVLGKELEVNMEVFKDKDGNTQEKMLVDSESVKASLALSMRKAGMEDKQITAFMEHLSNQALAAGNGAYGNMVKRDEHGNFKLTNAQEQAFANAGKLALLDPQKIANGMHADTLFRRDHMGNYVGLNGLTAREVMNQTFNVALGDQAGRMKNTKKGFAELWKSENKELADYYDTADREQKYAIAKVMYQAGVWKDNPKDINEFEKLGLNTFAQARVKYP